MSTSYTTTDTWSRTHARYVAGKVAADLRQMQQEYGRPGDAEIADYMEELTEYLAAGYLDYVDYGFKRGDAWVVGQRYTGTHLFSLTADDRSGRIPRGASVEGACFTSYLVRNSKWWELSEAQRESFKSGIVVKRVAGDAPSLPSGGCVQDKTYSSAGGGVRRAVFGGVA